ncbi:MAG TPA: heparinase II/III family protein [Gemmatimonadaceae bacterium]|nr:heparinase II/III family protein [Gemmatimonadaceae bacterium]
MVLSPDASRLAKCTDLGIALARADRVLRGEYQAFRSQWRPLPKSPDEWRRNAVTGYVYEADQPWWLVKHLDADAGDIKQVWEPSRFAWAYDLARAFLLTGEERHAGAFEKYFASWHAGNPAFFGPNWSCGQETAIRSIALLYAEAVFRPAHLRSAEMLAATLCASGERIADAIGYAMSQRNNHSISEATALIALGVRFQSVHPAARGWITLGKSCLEDSILDQFAEDGWYAQHSFNYLRLALDQCTIAETALLRAIGSGLSTDAVSRLQSACGLLATVIDAETGEVPNHGSNDGAFVLPITTALFSDYRPVLTAASARFGSPVPSDIPLDLEPLAWLSLEVPKAAPPREDGVRAGVSGWVAVRIGAVAAFLRAAHYRNRPGHIDALHLDIRYRGAPVVVDPGTFSYNQEPPWNNGLAVARVHNGPILDDIEPGMRGPRFLWLTWPSARILSVRMDNGEAFVSATLDGRVERRVHVTTDRVYVTDAALATGAESLRVSWLLHPGTPRSVFRSESPFSYVEASPGDALGWLSPVYDERVASYAIVVEKTRPAHLRIDSEFCLANRTDVNLRPAE